ncbi:MAG: undecaprenyl-phosphate glucose phosphotransferase [Planctomycetia bacterium]|jgi:Undecaprenyl-phosphate glucose phosphotransferase
MIQRRSQLLIAWFFFCDLLATALAWLLAYQMRFESGWIPMHSLHHDGEISLSHLPWVLFVAVVAYQATGQYRISRMRRMREELFCTIQGTFFLVLMVLAVDFFRKDLSGSRAMVLLFSGLNVLWVFLFRQLNWSLIRTLRTRGYDQSFSIIVGTGRVARKMANTLTGNTWLGIRNIGFVEDNLTQYNQDLDILGKVEELPTLVSKYSVSHVFIALPMNRYDDVRKVYSILADCFVDIRLAADIPELSGLSLSTVDVDGMPLVSLRENPHFGLNVMFKRGMDIILSLVGLIIISPLLLLVAAMIKLTSRGPVFYRQERCGLNGQPFQMLKFRSMKVDAEKDTGAVWARKNDDRRTILGTFLRSTSIDELPQLINVLKGEMSLVGPRPERPVFIDKFRKTIPNYMARHSVKAGITGWAQVHGWRGNTSLRKRLQYDLYYITHWTPWMDIRILWMTIFKGMVHRNAY